jgi:hypothetical protein
MLKNKEKFWKIFTKKNKHSFDYIRNAMETFHWKIQKEKLKPYIDKFFKSSISIFNTKSEQYGRIYSACLFPTYHPTPKTIAKAKLFLSKNPKAPKLLKKAIIEKIDGLERVLRVRNKFP